MREGGFEVLESPLSCLLPVICAQCCKLDLSRMIKQASASHLPPLKETVSQLRQERSDEMRDTHRSDMILFEQAIRTDKELQC